MITTLPSVTRDIKYCYIGRYVKRQEKRIANRRYRRALNRATRAIFLNPERWYDEPFTAPYLSSWDLD